MNIKLIIIALFILVGIIFLFYPETSNRIISTDLFKEGMGTTISYIISLFAFLSAISLMFQEKFIRITDTFLNRINSFFENKGTVSILAVILILNLAIKLTLALTVPETFYYHDGAQYSSLALNIYEGEGFISNSLQLVLLPEDSIPFQETARAPLIPYIIAGSYSLLGVSFFSEIIVFVLISSLIPVAGYLLFKRLSNKKLALLGAFILSLDWIVFTNSRVIHTELPFMLFGMLFLLALFNFRERKLDYLTIGLTFALAYLTRYQALFFLPIIVVLYLYMRSGSVTEMIKQTTVIMATFLAIISPWLLRNLAVAGGPFSNGLSSLIVGHYGGRDYSHYVYSLDTVPETLFGLIATNPLMVITEYFNTFIGLLSKTPLMVFNNPLLVAFFIIGIIHFRKYTQRKEAYALFTYIILSYATISFTLPVARYIYHLIPVYVFFAVLGMYYIYKNMDFEKINLSQFKSLVVLSILFILSINISLIGFAYADLDSKGESSLGTFNLYKDFITPNDLERSTFMVDSFPYFYEYYSRGESKVLQFPYYTDDQDFYNYLEKYDVDYIVLHKDSILRIPVELPEDFIGKMVFENDLRVVLKVGE